MSDNVNCFIQGFFVCFIIYTIIIYILTEINDKNKLYIAKERRMIFEEYHGPQPPYKSLKQLENELYSSFYEYIISRKDKS